MSRKSDPRGVKIDGVKAVAEMLAHMDEENRNRLMGELAGRDPKLLEDIRKRMFVFEDIIKLEKKAAQALLQDVPRVVLLVALRNAPQEILDFVLSNMSKRAGELLMEELAAQEPRRISDIEAARAEIIRLIARLRQERKI
ncbi:MAG: hypothetical protein A2583_03325 [Bdellovibrionales bacterium RIFOXYD1_FULL_53_11]|nr:MAG: hypothetical protein A2583_03325 [Bdellovibrionales bacterium RIFOXYD1_FULL_53_11]